MKILTCPDCGSSDLYYETGLITGYKYHCKKCQYVGPFVIEREVRLDAEETGNGGKGQSGG
jgi:transposase-like protein